MATNLDSLDLCMVDATEEEHFADIMRISEGIYEGDDYLPYVLRKWMADPHHRPVGTLKCSLIFFFLSFPLLPNGF